MGIWVHSGNMAICIVCVGLTHSLYTKSILNTNSKYSKFNWKIIFIINRINSPSHVMGKSVMFIVVILTIISTNKASWKSVFLKSSLTAKTLIGKGFKNQLL